MNGQAMHAFVIVATKGRAVETFHLLDCLASQTLAPRHVLIAGSEPADIAGLDSHPLTISGRASTLIAPRAGLTIQRNAGLDALARLAPTLTQEPWFVVFFDDDFRPAADWLEQCGRRFSSSQDVVGICGNVLADGIRTTGFDETTARDYLIGRRAPEPHWAHRTLTDLADGLYGCNMAYRDTIAQSQRFDEDLPLYGWQEDIDYAGRARKLGRLICDPACRGVHMGVQGARTSGVRFGYSQIANPAYLIRKGSMRAGFGTKLACRNIASNLFNTLRLNRRKDYSGRLRGNLHALFDAGLGKLHPTRILSL